MEALGVTRQRDRIRRALVHQDDDGVFGRLNRTAHVEQQLQSEPLLE
jgi:hypothetical protein